MNLAGKVAWVGGGSSGIGAAVARELLRRGATVAVSARRKEQLHELAHPEPRPPEAKDTMKLLKTVVVEKPLDAVFGYLTDFTTTTDWDPGTVTTVRRNGNGGVGTTYLNTSTFLGRTTQLTYVVDELVDQQLIQLRGENKTVIAVDTLTFRPVASGTSGTEVTYAAEFTFKGLSRIAAPLLKPAFERLGNEAEAGMRKALNRL